MSELGQHIRLLGDLLGKIIIEQSGTAVFELEETIRGLSKNWCDGDSSAREKVSKIVSELVRDLPLTSDILKAFSTYFQLVNLAEEHARIRILSQRANKAFQEKTTLDESITAAIEVLKQEGFTAEEVCEMLGQMLIMPVFTAHPTESRRRTIRQILKHISSSLNDLETKPEYQHAEIRKELAEYITLLWQSDESRRRKPTVMDEVRNTGLYFFENTLFDVVPRIYLELEGALAKSYPDCDWQVPTILRFGSWIGGDRDGNPFVTPETTESAIRTHKEIVLNRYCADVQALYEMLSPSLDRSSFDARLLQQLNRELKHLPATELESVMRFEDEPYRQKLILMYRRLQATIEQNVHEWHLSAESQRSYSDVGEFLDDLLLIEHSLQQNKGEVLSQGRLARLIRRVRVFGFHLASLDIRQHSNRHETAIEEIFSAYNIATYSELEEEERIHVLAHEIQNRRPLTAELNFSEQTNETVSLFRKISVAHQRAGEASIPAYIISMTESVSDILEVLLLMSDAGLTGTLDIVPLFETVEDLVAAPAIMSKLFENRIYQDHLHRRGESQQIMIGYSDSNKDGGFLRANWMLFTAQRQLAETCRKHDVKLTLFHGRGGSIGRGGGPANRAILAQPPESIRGRIRITEQGEVVSSRYTHPEIAQRHLQQLFHAVLCSGGRRPEFDNIDRWSEIVEQLSQLAFHKYRRLVQQPEFIDYFQTATPIDQIDFLNLGSRPARRKTTQSISDLRAIPWVFAWTQSRTNIPSWYGLGTAFQQWIDNTKDGGLLELQEMYEHWPFFNTLLGNVHLGLGRADMEIAWMYSQLVNPEFSERIFDDIRNEFELSKKHVLQITGHEQLLDTEKWLQHSIRMRNPYVDPMNYIQTALLKRFRETEDPLERDAIQSAILQSVSGIAGGLQNVG